MHYYALAIGIIIAVYVVVRFRNTGIEKKKWVYPVFLATFPMYYWVFAVYASDYGALINELAIGLGFLAIAYVAYKLNSVLGLLLLSFGYITHAGYDLFHNSLFYNAGTPLWWPEFCGAVDGLVGLYLVVFAFSMKQGKVTIAQ